MLQADEIAMNKSLSSIEKARTTYDKAEDMLRQAIRYYTRLLSYKVYQIWINITRLFGYKVYQVWVNITPGCDSAYLIYFELSWMIKLWACLNGVLYVVLLFNKLQSIVAELRNNDGKMP